MPRRTRRHTPGIESGAYRLGSKAFEFRFTTVAAPVDVSGDFQIAATARHIRGGSENHFGLLWRVLDGRNFYFFSVDSDANVRIGVMEKGQTSALNTRDPVQPGLRTPSGEYRLTIVKARSKLRFLVNGTIVHEMAFRPFFGPGVGFGAFHGPIVAEFDDLAVEQR